MQKELTFQKNILKSKTLLLPFNVHNDNNRKYIFSEVEEPSELVPLFLSDEAYNDTAFEKHNFLAQLKITKENDGLYITEMYPSFQNKEELPQYLTFLYVISAGVGELDQQNTVRNFKLSHCFLGEDPAFKQLERLDVF